MSAGLVIAGAEVRGESPVDVRVEAGEIRAVARALRPGRRDLLVDAGGGALLPGLHDHHVHLLSLAAALTSVQCGPPAVRDREGLRRALRAAAAAHEPGDWVRGVGYHESVAGSLGRGVLDGFVADRPVRVQHRSGAAWFLNSAALARLGLDGDGQLYGRDRWLRAALGPSELPDLAGVGERLVRLGVTGVTDATATNGPQEAEVFARSPMPQRVVVMGGEELSGGWRKLVVAEHDPPPIDELAQQIRVAHQRARAVAVHCVTRAALVLTLAAFEVAGVRAGDRIEHASVAPPEAVHGLRRLGLTVVTQPNFVAERGDDYLDDVDADDVPWLYRVRGYLEAGVPVGGGTDAPFGDPDPWRAMRAAVERTTPSGAILGAGERVTPEQALALFTSPPERPGGPPRFVAPGAPADLCLLGAPWREAREELSSELVRLVVRAGRVVYEEAR